MMKSLTLLASTLLLLPTLVSASVADTSYQFTTYAEKVQKSSRLVKVKIVTAKDRKYASALREAASAKADFAGHYILASWGCGASCVVSAAIDATDGSIHWFPYTLCCWGMAITAPLEYKIGSRLLITHGKLNERGKDDNRYYEFLNGKFNLLRQEVLVH